MNEAFLRQRRNVIVASTILLALCLGGVDLQELTFAGMKFSAFKRPEVFLYGVWIAFGYFTYRYVVHFREFSPKQMEDVFFREMDGAVNRRIFELVRRDIPNAVDRKLGYKTFLSWGRIYHGDAGISDESTAAQQVGPFSLAVPFGRTIWWECLGILRFVFLTPVLTDHILPIGLSAGTLIYCGFIADWNGNLLPVIRGFLGLG